MIQTGIAFGRTPRIELVEFDFKPILATFDPHGFRKAEFRVVIPPINGPQGDVVAFGDL